MRHGEHSGRLAVQRLLQATGLSGRERGGRARGIDRRRAAARRRLRLEPLEDRRLLAAATDLTAIAGLVFDDSTGNGFDAGEQVAGATVNLYRDDGDGLFDPAMGDALIGTTTTDAAGRYRFDGITAGGYFVEQPSQVVADDSLQQSVSPPITVTAVDVAGQLITTVDSFDTTTQSVVDTTGDGVPVTSSVAAPDAIGGERDLLVNKTSVNGAVQISVNDPLLPGLFSFDSILTGQGARSVVWDGVDGTALVVDDSGLAGTDITSGGTASGFRLQIGADLAGGTAMIRLYSDDGAGGTSDRFSSTVIDIPATGGLATSVEFIPFSAFTTLSGGGADLTQIGAIEMEITGVANVNGSAELVGAVGPTIVTQDFANFETADLRLAKAVDDPDPTLGQSVLFTITTTNDGPDSASGISVTDLLPSGVTFVSATPSQGSYDSASGLWTIGTLGNLAAASLQIVGTVASTGVIINTAQITASGAVDPDSTPGNSVSTEDDQASVTLTPRMADLSLLKTVDDASPDLDQNVTFAIQVANAGPDTATGVVVTDRLPAGLAFVSATPSQGTFDNGTGIWNVGDLISGGTVTLQLVARVDAATGFTNTAEITAADQADPDSTPGNAVVGEDDQASVAVTPTVIDLSLAKSTSTDRPNLGQTVTYTLALSNAGPDSATGVAVSDPLPAGVTFVSSLPSQGAYDAATGIWNVGTVAGGAGATLQLMVRVDTAGTKLNVAEVTAADQVDIDSTPANGVADEDDRATVALTPATADLSLTKSADDSTPGVGQTVTYTLVVTNAGPDEATGLTVGDPLPAGVTFVSSSPGQGSYDSATGIWTVGTLASGGSATLQVLATADAASAVTNTAQVLTSDQLDPDSTPGNSAAGEDDQATTTITPELVDLALTKSISDAAPNVGQNVTFTIEVTNAGPSTASGVIVSDTLSPGLDFVSASPNQGSFDDSTGVWTVGSVASGAAATLQLVARVDTAGTATNEAEITAADQVDSDSTPGNDLPAEDDQATVSLTTPVADVSLTKSIDNASPNVGDAITFSVAVANAGPDTATGVRVVDVLPPGTSFISSTVTQGTYTAGTGLWTVGSIASGGTATLQVLARIDASGLKTNTAEISAADQADPDSTPGNAVVGEDDQASVAVTPTVIDLSLTKSADDSTPGVGQTVTYTLVVTNAGPDAATGLTVGDPLPAGVTFVSSSPGQGSYDSATGIWTVGTLASGGSATLQVLATADAASAVTNTAEVLTSDQLDPDSTPGNSAAGEDDQATTTITPELVDLALTKVLDDMDPNAGQQITYTLTLTNAGPSTASGVEVRDQLPSGLAFVSSTASLGSYDSATGIWTVGSVSTTATPTLQIVATVGNTAGETNVAEITATDQPDVDSTPGNDDSGEDDQASVGFTTQRADLSLTKTVDNPSPGRNDAVQFAITVTNAGPSTGENIVVQDVLPGGLTLVSSSGTQGVYDASTGRWTIGNLATGAAATLTINVTAASAGATTNTAEIVAVDQFDPDSTPGNNVVGEDDLASAAVTPLTADLAVTASIDNQAPGLGDTVTLQYSITNSGPSDASGVAARVLVPAGLTLVSSSPDQGSYDSDTGIWTVGSLDVGETQTLRIVATVDTFGIKRSSIQVIAVDQFDPDSVPDNDSDSEDDQATVAIRAPRILSLRLFLSR